MLNIFHEGYPDCFRSFCDEDVPSKNFRVFNVRIFEGSQKYFYTENFRIYGTYCIILLEYVDEFQVNAHVYIHVGNS